jgi:hypothetical protein
MTRVWAALIAALVWTGLVCYGGYLLGDAKSLSREAAYERQAKLDLQEAQLRGDALTTGLLTQQGQIDQLKTEKQHAVQLATTGRTCLGSDALRVLDHSPGITFIGPTQAASTADAADATPATDIGVSSNGDHVVTDTSVAQWIVDAGASYEVCRARLDALIDWNLGKKP